MLATNPSFSPETKTSDYLQPRLQIISTYMLIGRILVSLHNEPFKIIFSLIKTSPFFSWPAGERTLVQFSFIYKAPNHQKGLICWGFPTQASLRFTARGPKPGKYPASSDSCLGENASLMSDCLEPIGFQFSSVLNVNLPKMHLFNSIFQQNLKKKIRPPVSAPLCPTIKLLQFVKNMIYPMMVMLTFITYELIS